MFKFLEKIPPVNSEVLVDLKNIESPDECLQTAYTRNGKYILPRVFNLVNR